jgi:hypothetical protein
MIIIYAQMKYRCQDFFSRDTFYIFQHELHLCLDVDCDEKVSSQVSRASNGYGGMHRMRFYAEL